MQQDDDRCRRRVGNRSSLAELKGIQVLSLGFRPARRLKVDNADFFANLWRYRSRPQGMGDRLGRDGLTARLREGQNPTWNGALPD